MTRSIRRLSLVVAIAACVIARGQATQAQCFGTGNYVLYGATLGNGWAGFPDRLAMDYVDTDVTQHPDEAFDVTLPIYITWVVSNADPGYFQWLPGYSPGVPTRIDPPVRLSDQVPWFHEAPNPPNPTKYYDRKFKVRTIGFGDDPYNTSYFPPEYTTCPTTGSGRGLELPLISSFPLDSSGALHVRDVHGGIATKTTIVLQRDSTFVEGCIDPKWRIAVVIGWINPGRWVDDPTGLYRQVRPGDTVEQIVRIDDGGAPRRPIYCQRKTVEWVNGDTPGASPGTVDASDLAGLATELGHAVRWGWQNESPPNSRNYQFNFVPFGDLDNPGSGANRIDASDLAGWAADQGKGCGLQSPPKPDAVSELAAILEWFGIARTGQMVTIVPGQPQVPGYDVVDWLKLRRAIVDPYGYKTHPASVIGVTWSTAKTLYR